MPFDANGNYIPDNTTTADRVTALTTGSSPLITAARNSGLQTANKRGLLNSSIAAGSSEAAAIAAATPIASQDSSNAATLNNTQLAGANAIKAQTQSEAAAKDLSAQGFTQSQTLQQQQDAATSALTDKQLAATSALTDKQLAASTSQNDKSLAATSSNLDRQLAASSQEAALTSANQANANYASALVSLSANTDIPAATRDQYLQTLLAARNSQADAIKSVYGITLNWS